MNTFSKNAAPTDRALEQALERLPGAPPSLVAAAPHLERGPGTVYLLDLDRRPLYVSNPAETFLPEAFAGLAQQAGHWEELVAERSRADYLAALAGGETSLAYLLKAGATETWIPVRDHLYPLSGVDGESIAYLGRLEDDSDRFQSLDTIARRSWKDIFIFATQRLMHDFNNAIAGIYSLSELYAEPGSSAETMAEAMGHIRDNSIRAQKIVQLIRSLATSSETSQSYCDVDPILKELDLYLAAILPKDIHVDWQLGAAGALVRIDPHQLKLAVLHLAINARQALSKIEEPRVSIRTRVDRQASPPVLSLEIQDNGCGFSPAALENAFKPFFTTRDPAKQSGVGLFAVRTVATQVGGACSVGPAPEGGALVALSLPIANLSETIDTSPPAAATPRDAKPQSKPPVALIYSWEDIARHPLINAMRTENWRYRIHLDGGQLLEDIRHMEGEVDAIVIFKSPLDEKAEPLTRALAARPATPAIALVTLGESPDALPRDLSSICGLVVSGSSKPAATLKKIIKLIH